MTIEGLKASPGGQGAAPPRTTHLYTDLLNLFNKINLSHFLLNSAEVLEVIDSKCRGHCHWRLDWNWIGLVCHEGVTQSCTTSEPGYQM